MPKAATSKAPKEKAEKAEKKVSRFTSPYIPNTPYSPLPSARCPQPRAAKKEKEGPKRPLSAFMYFCKDWRERVKAENPEASFGASRRQQPSSSSF